MGKINPKIIVLAAGATLFSIALGFSLESIFASGLQLGLSGWFRFIPLVLSFLALASFATVLALVGDAVSRGIGFALAGIGFGLPFFLPPEPVRIPFLFSLALPVIAFGGLLLLDYSARFSVKTHTIFAARIFIPAYYRLFLLLSFAVGLLVYFSAAVVPLSRFKIPEEILDPALTLVVNRVIEQVQDQIGPGNFTEEQFVAELQRSGLLQVLEQQFGVSLSPNEIGNPEKLAESLREPLIDQLTQDLDELLEPYRTFLPLAAAAGATLSVLFLSPIFTYLSVVAFAIAYRLLILARLVYLAQEQRPVPVLKIV